MTERVRLQKIIIEKADAAAVIRSVRGHLDGLDADKAKKILDAIKGAFETDEKRTANADKEQEEVEQGFAWPRDVADPTRKSDLGVSFGPDPAACRLTPEEKRMLEKARARRVWSADEALAMQDPRFAPGGEFDFDKD